jgi:membrane carboxypeptidase/penicillin-binding protein PbpC
MLSFPATEYFKHTRLRPDRLSIKDEWIVSVLKNPMKEEKQYDGRYRIWGKIEEFDNRFLRVILLEDKKTIHNAFFDRDFKP